MKKYLPFIIIAILLAAGLAYYAIDVSNSEQQRESSTMMDRMMNHDEATAAEDDMGYTVQLNSDVSNLKSGQPVKISYKIFNKDGEELKDFTVAHEKLMHFIVVRKDLQYFQHLHPEKARGTGEFTVEVTFPADGPYRIFPDFTPTPDNPKKLAVALNEDINVGDLSKYKPQPVTVDSEIQKISSGFSVNYNLPDRLKANESVEYSLIVEKPGSTVKLQPYLGALGHSVILKEGSLEYIHAHDMEMGQMDHQMMGEMIMFGTKFPSAGKYKIFTQFQVDGQVVTSDYTVQVGSS